MLACRAPRTDLEEHFLRLRFSGRLCDPTNPLFQKVDCHRVRSTLSIRRYGCSYQLVTRLDLGNRPYVFCYRGITHTLICHRFK